MMVFTEKCSDFYQEMTPTLYNFADSLDSHIL